jgi:hypothetical protein
MSRLYLHCALCSRRQADGLISGAAWGRLRLPDGIELERPELAGTNLRACPTCIQRHQDWHDRLLVALGVADNGAGPSPTLPANS